MTWTTRSALENLMKRPEAETDQKKNRIQITSQFMTLKSGGGPQGTVLVRKFRQS